MLRGGREAAVEEFESQVVGFFVSAAELLGVPKSVAAIYGVLFASPLPLSFAAIAERVDLSRGSVSQGLRALREIGAVKEVSTPADRAELFTPDTEMRKLIAHFLETRVQQQLDSGKKRLAAFEPPLDHYSPAEQKVLKARLQKLRRWHDRTRKLVPVIRTFLKLASST